MGRRPAGRYRALRAYRRALVELIAARRQDEASAAIPAPPALRDRLLAFLDQTCAQATGGDR